MSTVIEHLNSKGFEQKMPVQNSSSDSTKPNKRRFKHFWRRVFLMGRNKVKKSPYAEITSLKTSVLKFVYKQLFLCFGHLFRIVP